MGADAEEDEGKPPPSDGDNDASSSSCLKRASRAVNPLTSATNTAAHSTMSHRGKLSSSRAPVVSAMCFRRRLGTNLAADV